MSIYVLTKDQYQRARARKERQHQDEYAGLYVEAMYALGRIGSGPLGISGFMTMFYLINRTVRFNKLAQHITSRQFTQQITNAQTEYVYSSPLCLSQNAREKALRDLAERDFLHIYRCEDVTAGFAPIYEIECKTLLGYSVKDEKTDMPLRELKTKRAQDLAQTRVENTQKPLPSVGGEPPHLLGGKNTDTKKSKSFMSSNRSATDETSLSARDKVDQIMERHAQARSTRTASASAKPAYLITKDEAQAVVDSVMRDYYATLPRVIVTHKDFGLLRKRMKESAPSNFREFIAYIASSWSTIVQQNTKAQQKRQRSGDKVGESLGAAFNIRDLALRYPYFLKIFVNGTVSAQAAVESSAEVELRRVRSRLQNTETENAKLRQLVRTKPSSITVASRRPARGTSAAPIAALSDEDLLAGFDDLIAGANANA
jgi:hypothetical protein